MNRRWKTLVVVLGVIAVSVLIAGAVWWRIKSQSFPKVNGTVTLEGLHDPVEIYRDSYGIPHIYAHTSDDLFFAEGYVHAQDRFWQMEFWRRIGQGRLSELFGDATLGTDIYLRTVGFARIAEQEYAMADPTSKAFLDAYSAGVNAYIKDRSGPQLALEFSLLDLQGVPYEIEPWTPVNSLTWIKLMAQDLGGNMEDELDRLNLIHSVGLQMTSDFIPAFRSDFPVIVPDEEIEKMNLPQTNAANPADTTYLAEVRTQLVGGFDQPQSFAFGGGEGIGSNDFVISGDLTTTGMPLLANDPHLGIQMPSIWYELGLHCVNAAGEVARSEDCPFELRGFSFAGVPGIVLGHNDRIAWGFTNVNPDVQDLVVERINPDNPNQYEVNGEWVDMDIRREEIKVSGQDEPLVILARSTRHGPVMTDRGSMGQYANFEVTDQPLPDNYSLTVMSLRWTALQPTRSYQAIWRLNQAANWDEFRQALSYFDVPSQNVVYADVDGNIGYQMPGLVPIRASGDGTLPVPGWNDDYEWTGFIPFDDLPRAFNPDQGYIATANQTVVSDVYPYFISSELDHGYRAHRINQMIHADTDGISIEDIAAIQGDNLSLSSQEIIPYLESLSLDDPALVSARDRLLDWDGQMHMDSPEAALFANVLFQLSKATFNDQLPESLWPIGGTRTQDALFHLLQQPENVWWDDATTLDTVENRDDILLKAFTKGYEASVDAMGDNMDSWRWGDIHTAMFANATFGRSGISLIESIFNRGPVAVSGGTGIVNATNWSGEDDPFEVSSLPSMRQIVDMSDLSATLMIHTTGQSGHPGSPHYDDFIDPWRLIQYHPALWDRQAIEDDSKDHLTLVPPG